MRGKPNQTTGDENYNTSRGLKEVDVRSFIELLKTRNYFLIFLFVESLFFNFNLRNLLEKVFMFKKVHFYLFFWNFRTRPSSAKFNQEKKLNINVLFLEHNIHIKHNAKTTYGGLVGGGRVFFFIKAELGTALPRQQSQRNLWLGNRNAFFKWMFY